MNMNSMSNLNFNGAIKVPRFQKGGPVAREIIAKDKESGEHKIRSSQIDGDINMRFLDPETEASAVDYLKQQGVNNYIHWNKPNLGALEYEKFENTQMF